MPLFGKKDNNTVDYKARLEHKLYLARENPEPIFDLSDCSLKVVPSGIYSLCKVFRKDALYLQENSLPSLAGGGTLKDLSLLQVLDIHSNCFSVLPDEISLLKNLRMLNVSCNKLKSLPDTFGSLGALRVLNLSSNCLRRLPSCVGKLRCLQQLDIRNNKDLLRLPSELCQATNLADILLDSKGFVHPPRTVVELGSASVMKFLAQECGVEYVSPSENVDNFSPSAGTSSAQDISDFEDKDRIFQGKILQLEKLKEQKQQERITLERNMEEQYKKELDIQNAMKLNKGKLLEDLVEQQNKLERKIMRVQHDKDTERHLLVQQLQEVEKAADEVISQLLACGGNIQNASQLQHLVEQEMLEEERLLNIRQEEYQSLRHKDVLKAMEAILEDECRQEEKLREYEEGRAVTTRTLLSQEVESDKQLVSLLTSQGRNQSHLIHRLQEDEELQRAAVGALLERSDARSCGLVHQVALVEIQLASLTNVEMERRKLEITDQLTDLSEKRVALSLLLVELLAQQAERRSQLLRTLEKMECRRCALVMDQEEAGGDFWLHQYQRLLDSRPGSLVKMQRSLDPLLAQHLVLAGAIHCLPFISQWVNSPEELAQLNHFKLSTVGVTLMQDQDAILDAVRLYLEEQERISTKLGSFVPTSPQIAASAPPQTPTEPPSESERTFATAECAICMEEQCEVIFIPCGHMCCCIKCAELVKQCPMCRGDIGQKIRAILP